MLSINVDCHISYWRNADVIITPFTNICWVVKKKRNLKQAVPILLHGFEIWAMKQTRKKNWKLRNICSAAAVPIHDQEKKPWHTEKSEHFNINKWIIWLQECAVRTLRQNGWWKNPFRFESRRSVRREIRRN